MFIKRIKNLENKFDTFKYQFKHFLKVKVKKRRYK